MTRRVGAGRTTNASGRSRRDMDDVDVRIEYRMHTQACGMRRARWEKATASSRGGRRRRGRRDCVAKRDLPAWQRPVRGGATDRPPLASQPDGFDRDCRASTAAMRRRDDRRGAARRDAGGASLRRSTRRDKTRRSSSSGRVAGSQGVVLFLFSIPTFPF